jgi:anti-sigma-K factor RskA
MSGMSQEEARALLGAYALGALGKGERDAVEAQLQASAELRAELAEHQRALSRLTQAEPQLELPTAMKADLFTRLGASPINTPTPQPKRKAGLWESLTRGIAVPRFALAAAVLVAALGLGGLGYRVVQLSNQRAAQRQALDLITDTSAVSVKLKARPAAPNAAGRIRYKPNSNIGILETWDLPVLEANRIYQLWLVYPDNTRDTGALFKIVSEDGTATVLIMAPKAFGTYTNFGISIEPDGGSPGPTGPGVLSTRG